VLLLRVVDEMSVEETAAALKIPEGTVKSRLHQALEKLRGLAGRGEDVTRP
jgi:DNA-directed RNA polymerase specialized sigma24 family protein